MNITSLLIFLAIGALAGWLAGNIMKGRGFGVIGNIVVGIIGAVLGGFLFGLLGITAGWVDRFDYYSNRWRYCSVVYSQFS